MSLHIGRIDSGIDTVQDGHQGMAGLLQGGFGSFPVGDVRHDMDIPRDSAVFIKLRIHGHFEMPICQVKVRDLALKTLVYPMARTVLDGAAGSMDDLPALLPDNIGCRFAGQFNHGPVALYDTAIGIQYGQGFVHGVERVLPHFGGGLHGAVGLAAASLGL